MTKIGASTVNGVAIAALLVCLASGECASASIHQSWPAIAGAAVGLYLLFAIKVVRQWEKVALLRLGKYVGLRGPGLFAIVPVIESANATVMYHARNMVTTYQESSNKHQEEIKSLTDDVRGEWMENWYYGLGFCKCDLRSLNKLVC